MGVMNKNLKKNLFLVDFTYQIEIAKKAKDAGAKKISIISAVGANSQSWNYYLKTKGNPNEFLGKRHDLTPDKFHEIAKKFKENGATIIGGCCETGPAHIKAMAKLK